MKNYTLAIGIASTLAVGLILYFMNQRKEADRRLNSIADAGYETAGDILYPIH
jgi:hypothetical protein